MYLDPEKKVLGQAAFAILYILTLVRWGASMSSQF